MKRLFVKICGITRAQDAELAANLGASALGFVFWPDSPRYVDARTVTAMTANVSPNVLKVGVFVDQPVADVARMMDEAGLDVAQLHGHESPEYCRQLMVRLKADTTEARVDTTEVRVDTTEVRVDTTEARVDTTEARVDTTEVRVDTTGARVDTTEARVDARVPVVSGFSRTLIKAIRIADSGSTTIDDFDPDVVLLVDADDPERFGGTGKSVNWDAAREIAATRRTILAGGLNAANIKLAVRSVRPYGVDVSSGVESAPGVKDPNRLRTFFEALHD